VDADPILSKMADLLRNISTSAAGY